MPEDSTVETCRGFVNTWECDENNHFNVQFYFAKKSEADAHFRTVLGLPPSNLPEATSIIRPHQDHVRFHAELLVADTFTITTGVCDIGDTNLTVFHTMSKSSGELAATIVTEWQHVHAHTGTPSAWDQAIKVRAAQHLVDLPDFAQRRSADRKAPFPDPTLDEIRHHEPLTLYRGLVQPADCDAYGYMTARHHISRTSDGAAHFWNAFGFYSDDLYQQQKGTVVLEYLLTYCRPFVAGDAIETISLVRSVEQKTINFTQILYNASTGKIGAIADPTAVLFDQRKRRTIPFTEEEREHFATYMRSI